MYDILYVRAFDEDHRKFKTFVVYYVLLNHTKYTILEITNRRYRSQ